jgi:hypothetical protein
MVRYLQQAQNLNGGFPASPGGSPGPDFTAWAALALAAAGINPQQQAALGGVSAYSYLVAHAAQLTSTTDFERELLVVQAAGTSPQSFGGRNLVAEILKRQITRGPERGAFEHELGMPQPGVNDTVFAVLALSSIHEQATSRAVELARPWLIKVQNAGAAQQGGGSWPAVQPDTLTKEPEHNVEMTGAAIQALNASGMHHSEPQARAIAFLREVQERDGGFPKTPSEDEANVASTAWAVQGIWSAGEDPESWRRDGGQPLSYMESMQHEDGSLQFDAGSYENPVWITAYAGLAFAGATLPLARVPPAERPNTPPVKPSSNSTATPLPAAAETGQGGQSAQPGSGVIAGGGGDGAKPFSRPQPQSDGHRRGGARELAKGRARASGPPAAIPSQLGRESTSAKATATGSRSESGRRSSGLAKALAESNGGAAAGGGFAAVRGVLLGASLAAFHGASGAPGLRGAGAGGRDSPWTAIAVAFAALCLAGFGAQLERRRPRLVL